MIKNDIVTLTISDISSDGNGVGRAGGMAVFVPHTAVGDIAEVRIAKLCGSYAYGILERLPAPSGDRIENSCPAYPKCGGCSFRHISYSAELKAKRGFIESALRRIGGLEIGVEKPLASGLRDRYRNKAQFPVSASDGGRLTAGLYAGRSHRVVPVEDCLLQDALTNRVVSAACARLGPRGVTPYNEKTLAGQLRHIVARRSGLSGQVMLCLVLNCEGFADESGFAAEMARLFPEISTIALNINRRGTNVIMGDVCRVIMGPGFLEDRLCGVDARLSPLSFFQINSPAAETLYRKISQLAAPGGGDTLLDLYCGAGTIGLSMSRSCGRLIGVESVPQAVADARRNAEAMGAENAEFIPGDAGQAARELVRRGAKIDIAITDPPRKGCGDDVIGALLTLAPRRIVMVSCNPATLARDLGRLCSSGYAAGPAWPVDMFPHTRHVEAAVALEKI
jgi:23S rRNA (uracil1939-C5)-methyltransferase